MPRSRCAVYFAPFAFLLLLSACASRPRIHPIARTIPECPGFTIAAAPITVDDKGGTFQLGGGSQISFEPGAVTAPTTFSFSALSVGGQKVAGVRISGPALNDFSEPVRLRIAYAGCPDIVLHEKQRLSIGIVENGQVISIGGAKSTHGKFVEAYLVHFSDYAIAL